MPDNEELTEIEVFQCEAIGFCADLVDMAEKQLTPENIDDCLTVTSGLIFLFTHMKGLSRAA